MPYIFDMPNGRDAYDRRSFEAERPDYADIELLKLLNGGGYHKQAQVPMQSENHMSYGYQQRADEEEEIEVSRKQVCPKGSSPSTDLLTMSSLHSTLPSINLSNSNRSLVTPLPNPPFIVDLTHFRHVKTTDHHKQDDFTMNRRYTRMSFNGRPYPPVPPEASTLARPLDDWSNEDILPSRHHDLQGSMQQGYSQGGRFFGESGPVYPEGDSNMFAFEPATYVNPPPGMGYHHQQQQQHSVWTPPHANAWSSAFPADFHAPVLHPRLVQLPERPITPHDTYRYPSSHVEQLYVAPPVPEVSIETINAAFAVWYANQVISLLGTPGSFRPGVGGASDEIWGIGGREKESWLRVGRSPPDYSKPWGRMGMITTPIPAPRKTRQRRPDLEPRDPWNVAWAHSMKPSSTFVNFILDMIQRMTISPTALVSAVWFLHGLGFHEGDGVKGAELRDFLRECRSYELESIEKRVATLGLMLAGKWLDDNSFLTKSWCEVTTIPVKQLDRMERIALADLHFSLHVPVSSWVDHVNKLYTALITKAIPDEVDLVITPIIDDMVTEARDVEIEDDCQIASPPTHYERRLSSDELPAAADQAISRDWGSFARTYGISQQDMRDLEVDVEMERAERDVNALVNDEYLSDEMEKDDEEDDEEFLDYDGAKKWLPSMSELKRSGSNSSDTSLSSYDSHGRGISQPTQPFHVPLDLLETPPRQRSYSDWTQASSRSDHSIDWESNDFLYPIAPSDRKRCHDCQNGVKPARPFQHAAYVEPGMELVQPVNYLQESQKGNTNMNIGSTSKRWGKPVGAVQW
ncbi:hypothetical protein I203_104357 [Kwoniella mangroviensis CBS 8507]|uniref:uncharacterized protein n=1 Tax=Kwoniella mangroviensis CBS 8507 TaxID=1296122 RepID=UPI00080D4F65|nr:uncharacterized protein I203_00696 [Kwoniella mangroviensis CBS 8507]OCF70561.1 hypothetical protein I203_00696 [Kwoniella mangroviensis CBS 8507]